LDYFDHQDRARAMSGRLVLLFALAVLATLVLANLAALAAWQLATAGLPVPRFFVSTNVFVVSLIVLGSAWIEWHRLGSDGAGLAARLQARTLDDADPLHRRLRDVAEEISVGAGVPVPSLYVLADDSINALAVGERPAVAAVMVTEGALRRLDRAELQGVVAHEIAHIVAGDSALNLRLTAALFGLYSLKLAGRHLMSGALRGSGLVRLLLPFALITGLLLSVLGWLGVIAAQVLRAGVGRQREFLADAIAVQFTRDRDGLGNALRRIQSERVIVQPAPADATDRFHAEYRSLVSAFMLVQPASGYAWFDSHPPIDERIRRLYGRFVAPMRGREIDATGSPGHSRPVAVRDARGPSAWLATPDDDRDSAGLRGLGRLTGSPVAALIARLRGRSLGEEEASRWLCVLIAGHRDCADDSEPDSQVAQALRWLDSSDGLALRVPVLELLLGRLRRWEMGSRHRLLDHCRKAIESDSRIDYTEWVHYTLARHRLLPPVYEPAGRFPGPEAAPQVQAELSQALAVVFSMGAVVGQCSARTTRDVLAETATHLKVAPPAATPDEPGTSELTRALDLLVSLPPLEKPLLLKMLRQLARTPGEPHFEAFVRAIAAAIDCPVPATSVSSPPAALAAG
jgi:Zn-dependent protease with chaperone function